MPTEVAIEFIYQVPIADFVNTSRYAANDKILGKIDQFGSITSVSCFSEVTAAQYNGNIKINATIKERIVKTVQDIVIFFVIIFLFPYLSKHNIAL